MGRLPAQRPRAFSYEMETSAAARLRLPLRLPGSPPPSRSSRNGSSASSISDLIATRPPSVIYKIKQRNGQEIEIHNPVGHAGPDEDRGRSRRPWIEATILTPDDYLGSVLKALPGPPRPPRRSSTYVGQPPRWLKYDTCRSTRWCSTSMDRLKSVSKGYASFDYHLTDFKARPTS